MPWSETSPMEQRARFVLEASQGQFSMLELCERYGVSRKTGYKWLERYSIGGLAGLEDRSRSARTRTNATPADQVERILVERDRWPRWGPYKIRKRLERLHPEATWPAVSTIGAILKRNGRIAAARRRARSRVVWASARTPADEPNRVWSVDFKGQFRLGNGRECYPLTLLDGHSRYLLDCRALESTAAEPVRQVFEAVFEAYGLPEVIRSDNGTPFSSPTALQGLSRLAVWWIKLGIRLERSRRGKPQDNGRHERMHRTLKQETVLPFAASDPAAQQERFERFRGEYNHQRPHQALEGQVPADRYERSTRALPADVPEPDYPPHLHRRLVRGNGAMKWKQREIFVSHALAYQTLGLEAIADRQYSVYFGPILLGRMEEPGITIHPGMGT